MIELTGLEILGIMFGVLLGITLIPIAIGLLVKGYWDIIVYCYSLGRGNKKYRLVKLKEAKKK